MINKLRKYVNKIFIESNITLVQEMQRYNSINGRIENSWRRMGFVMKLYFRYAICNKNPIKIIEKQNSKLVYPESRVGQKIKEIEVLQRIESAEKIVFDAWNVLFYPALDKKQLLTLFETVTGHVGISELEDYEKILTENELDILENIAIDFTIENEYINDIWEIAKSENKVIEFRNNSNQVPDRMLEKLLRKYEYRGNLYRESKGKVLHITTDNSLENCLIYIDVNQLGFEYRPYYHINTVTALYNQILNLKLHSSENERELFYEYGLIGGGILTCGFCQYLNKIAKQEGIDKFLFVARDGDIMQKLYDKYFSEIRSSYLIFSRFASYELIFEDYPEEYIEKNIKARIYRKKSDNSLKKILQECHLEFIEAYLDEEGLNTEDKLSSENCEKLSRLLIKHKDAIQESFQESCDAAKKYILQQVENSKKVCVIDLGWHGKSIVYLKHLLENKYKWKGRICGAMVGASCDKVTQDHIRRGLINSYAFESDYWRRMGSYNGEHMCEKEIICIEALFSSESDTLLRYRFNKNGDIDFIYGKKNRNKRNVKLVQKGIIDFAESIVPVLKKYHLNITARDAYMPLDALMRNKKFVEEIYQTYEEVPNAINGF